jgi:hypothetical protein
MVTTMGFEPSVFVVRWQCLIIYPKSASPKQLPKIAATDITQMNLAAFSKSLSGIPKQKTCVINFGVKMI